jgi:arginine dihydrolase
VLPPLLGERGRYVSRVDEPMVWGCCGWLAGKALGARLKHPQRQPESPVYLTWMQQAARGELTEVREPAHINECECDFVVVGELMFAGHGFRTDPSAHLEAQEFFGVPVASLELVDPRYYHLDTALAP